MRSNDFNPHKFPSLRHVLIQEPAADIEILVVARRQRGLLVFGEPLREGALLVALDREGQRRHQRVEQELAAQLGRADPQAIEARLRDDKAHTIKAVCVVHNETSTGATSRIDEVRKAVPWFYFLAGPRTQEKAELWSRDIIDLMRQYGGADQRLAVDRCEPWGAKHLTDAGIQLFDAQEPLELARMIKTPEEIMAMQLAVDVCDVGIERIRRALQPGITENELWSILHQTNIAHDGEWIECKLLTSGPRTNPWFQEAGHRVIEAGDLVAFDSDMVGPLGYLADISRTLVCPGRPPTAEQRKLYDIAQDQILTNIELIKPGLSFKEFGEKCWPVPDEYVPNRYMMMIHGAGLVDEFPTVAYAADYADWGYDGVFLENMVVCVESYIGAVGGSEGVKLEQQVLITDTGAVPMSNDPMIDALIP